ncbi:hypothetical protein AB0N97_40645 [Streptomyces collinus]|uniref:hypothetical protein n=1 Tax=Streptomyces collinus TaxID=42684 RepID=UPI0034338EAE
MDPITMAAGTALVSAMASDAWKQAKDALVAMWRGAQPGRAEAVGTELEALRPRIVMARQSGDTATEEALAGLWRLHLQEFLAEHPELIDDVRQLLEEQLVPALEAADRDHVQSIAIKSETHDQSRAYIAARDMHITGHDEF